MGNIDPEFWGTILLLLALAVPGCCVAVVAIICYHRRQLHTAEMMTALKQEMVQRGLSADEIERVLRASGTAGEQPSPKSERTRLAKLRREFVTELLDRGLSAEDVERLVRACGAGDEAAPLSESITAARGGLS